MKEENVVLVEALDSESKSTIILFTESFFTKYIEECTDGFYKSEKPMYVALSQHRILGSMFGRMMEMDAEVLKPILTTQDTTDYFDSFEQIVGKEIRNDAETTHDMLLRLAYMID